MIGMSAVMSAAMIWNSSSAESTDTGCISGYVTNHTMPFTNSPVFVPEESVWDITGPDGSFFIEGVSSGPHVLRIWCGDSGESDASVYVLPGDTIRVDLDYSDYDQTGQFMSEHWRPWPTASRDTLQVITATISLPDSATADGLSVSANVGWPRSPLCRTRRTGDDTYEILLPMAATYFAWSLPFAGDKTCSLHAVGRNQSIQLDACLESVQIDSAALVEAGLLSEIDRSDDEWVADGFSIERQIIDCSRWGDPALDRYGYNWGHTFFDGPTGSETWRLLLIYNSHAVVLREGEEPQIINFAFPEVLSVVRSPKGHRIVVYEDPFGGGNAEYLDLDSGNSLFFDPSPERPRPNIVWAGRDGMYGPCEQILLGDEGNAVALTDSDYIRIYNDNFSLRRIVALGGLQVVGYGWTSFPLNQNAISADGRRLVCLGSRNEHCELAVYSGNGERIWSIVPGSQAVSIPMITNTSCSLVAYGNTLFNGSTGLALDAMEFDDLTSCEYSVISPEGRMTAGLAWFRADSSGYLGRHVFRWAMDGTSPELFSIPASTWGLGVPLLITDEGSMLVSLRRISGSGSRVGLLSADGRLIWASPVNSGRIEESVSLSANGRQISYQRGLNFEILTLEEE
jgi:hypothetical protein